jgi:hypothetical protein
MVLDGDALIVDLLRPPLSLRYRLSSSDTTGPHHRYVRQQAAYIHCLSSSPHPYSSKESEEVGHISPFPSSSSQHNHRPLRPMGSADARFAYLAMVISHSTGQKAARLLLTAINEMSMAMVAGFDDRSKTLAFVFVSRVRLPPLLIGHISE